MTPRQALTKARKLYGDRAMVEWNPRLPDAEAKAALRVEHDALKEKHAKAKEATDALRAKLLADPEFVRLAAEQKRLYDAMNESRGFMFSDRARVGRLSLGGLAFSVEASGDTFGECFAKIAAKVAS